jgi:predicted membrane protein
VIGTLLGWGFLFISVKFLNSIMGSGNLIISLVAVLIAIANFVGIIAYPIIGFKLGAKHIFTTKRTVVNEVGRSEKQQAVDRREPKIRTEYQSSASRARLEQFSSASKEKDLKAWKDSEIETTIRYGEYLVSVIIGVWLGAVSSWWVGLFAAVLAVGLGELIIVSNRPD